MHLQPGDTFGRFTIDELLGEGGMGQVYRAFDTHLHRRVALKILRRATGDDPAQWREAAARMLREARAAAALNHPNTVALYDIGDHEGSPFLAMELIVGSPLRCFVGADVPRTTCVGWLLDVARALSAAHRAGIIHRDIKPENVMLRDDGAIKVLDFGIARRVYVTPDGAAPTAPALPSSLITSPGHLVGTPAYMAPEQLRGEDLDGRVDQFSWGVMAYELLSGRLPFGHGRDVLAVIACILGDPTPPLEGVPEPIAYVIERALAKRREDRFASMDELVELLTPFTTGELTPPSSGRPETSLPTTPPQAPVSPRELTTLSAGPEVALAPRSAPGGAAAPQVAAAPRRWPRWPFATAVVFLPLAAAVALTSRGAAPPPPAPAPEAPPGPPAPVPTRLTDLPPPQTSNPQALAAYREGLQAFCDAQWNVARTAFERAVALDPFFAAAHLRLAQTTQSFGSMARAREHLQRAVSLRAALDARDQALLGILEPVFLRDPPAQDEALLRAGEAARRYPGDAELLSQYAMLLVGIRPEESLEIAARCVAIDVRYADCWQSRARALLLLGRWDEALTALERCVAASPVSTDCLYERARVHERLGHCDRHAEDARRGLVHAPRDYEYHVELAAAMYGEGQPLDAARATLERGRRLASGPAIDFRSLLYEARLDTLAGDLRGAARTLDDAIRLAPAGSSDRRLAPAWLLRIQLLQELGDEQEAGRAAERFLTTREVMPKAPTSHDIWNDPTPLLLKAKLRADVIDRAHYEKERSAWLRDWEGQIHPRERGAAWIVGYAYPASTQEDAREALDALPRYEPLPPIIRTLDVERALGALHLLAGEPADALPHLARAAATCSAIKAPVTHTVAQYHLGLAREALGDSHGACAAYRIVLERWPLSSGSLTARAASARLKALRCSD